MVFRDWNVTYVFGEFENDLTPEVRQSLGFMATDIKKDARKV